MRVLLIGSGGREHAMARALAADSAVTELLAAPGNPGIGELARLLPLEGDDLPAAIAGLAVTEQVDLVVIGPEIPLVAGAADAVREAGIACFGPSKAAAQLEGSKAFAKEVMNAAGVPTAGHRVCSTPEQAAAALDEFGAPYVVKNDGLAAGKGVVVTDDREVALAHAASCGQVVIEEYLDGPEVSLFVLTDGTAVAPLPAAQDFKRVGDGNTGPNTGGMGAYAPLPWAPAELTEQVVAQVVEPTLAEMRRRGTPYQGLLYVGLALTSQGMRVVEFNARFGDPETQVVLPLLDVPFGQLLRAAATGRLAEFGPVRLRDAAAVTVVLAAPGYPGTVTTGGVLTGLDRVEQPADGQAYVLHAGTARDADGQLVATGGRVLCVTATGPDLAAARAAAYTGISRIQLDGSHYRTDIAAAPKSTTP